MAANTLDPTLITQIAGKHSVPPAILLAVINQGGDTLGLPSGSLTTSSGSDPTALVEQAAGTLASMFSQYHSWEQAISAYHTGDPMAYQSPTGAAGGFVFGVLGAAAANPTSGMVGYTPSSGAAFSLMSQGFGDHIHSLVNDGGVVTPQSGQQWGFASRQATLQSFGNSSGYNPQNVNHGWTGSEYRGAGGQDPYPHGGIFDPSAPTTQGYGPTSETMEPPGQGAAHFHTGVDYGVPDHSPLFSPIDGTIRIQQGTWGPGGNEVTVVADDGSSFLLGHVSGFNVEPGQRVTAGTQVATSGGAGEPGSGMSTGAHLHLEYRDPKGNLQDASTVVGQINSGAYQHPQATTPPPERFYQDVLKRAGLPVTPRNTQVLVTMQQGEGGDGMSRNNPLNSTQGMPGSSSVQGNSAGVQTYQSYDQGVQATAKTLINGNFGGLVAGLQNDQPPSYYASGPGAQALQTWQGGSQTDVNLMGKAPDPGANPGQDPSKVAEFATQLQGAGVEPEIFTHLFPFVSSARRKLLGSDVQTQISDLSKYVGMSTADVMGAIRGEPHPKAPQYSAGQVDDMQRMAMTHSVPLAGRMPVMSEIYGFLSGGASWKDVQQHYSTPPPPPPSQTTSDPIHQTKGLRQF